MLRCKPAVRALCERVRRPTSVRFLLGLAMIAPAGLINQGTHYMRSAELGTLPATATEASTKTPGPKPGQRILGTPVNSLLPGMATPGQGGLLGSAHTPNALTGTNPVTAIGSSAAPASAGQASATSEYAREFNISQPLADQIHEAAVAHGISPRTAFGLVRAESRFRTRAVSPVGAVGLTQIMPATARWLKPGTTRRELMEPSTNLNMGFRYLRRLIDKYDGNERLALTAFNRGPGTVNRLLRRGRNPDNGYADMVLKGKSTKHRALMNAKFGRKRR